YRDYGFGLPIQFNNKNVFRNAEIFQLTFRPSVEFQGNLFTGVKFSATQLSLSASILIPHILLPQLSFLPDPDHNVNLVNTKTTLNTSAIYEYNSDYERKVATIGLVYQFNKKLLSWFVSPFEFSLIGTKLNSSILIERAKTDIFLQNLFSNSVIMDARFGFTYSNKAVAKGKNFIFVKWDALEWAGNTLTAANMLLNSSKSPDGHYEAFGVNYYQYVKSDIDYRFNRIIDKNNAYVFRCFSGIIVPYGNSPLYSPFEKRFFVGGANDLRGWNPRGVGPGSYSATNQIDQSGDIKLEANGEYRFNVYNLWFEGALFADAGNVWALRPDITRPGADFALDRFYKEFAADAGIGIRLNFSIVLIRFDFAVPILNPGYSNLSDRLVITNVNNSWMKNTFNFAIGYPF
ncbi:MAG: BamA/TamA family outer membrane protein, partial [Bacteroidia bacterium]